MKNQDKYRSKFEKKSSLGVLIVNVFLIILIAVTFTIYSKSYQQRLRQENLNNISNLNHSAANIATAFYGTQELKLESIVNYIENQNMDLEETLTYLMESNPESAPCNFQIVGLDCKGYAVWNNNGNETVEVDYSYDYVILKEIFKKADNGPEFIGSTPEFTDDVTTLKVFAIYSYVEIRDENGKISPYTIMSVSKADAIYEEYISDNSYSKMATVLIDLQGNYLLSNYYYKSNNFFDYMYIYNDLTLDEETAMKEEMLSRDSGYFELKNSRHEECIYSYCAVEGRDWYCITGVPFDSFIKRNDGMGFTLVSAAIVLIMLLVDVTWLFEINNRMRYAIEKERDANFAKTEFLSRMSHDIRTPLNGIVGTTILALEENNSVKTNDYLRLIESSGNLLLSLVNDILDMSKVESGKLELHPEIYRHSDFVNYLKGVVYPLCTSKNIEFVINETIDDFVVLTDVLRLNQITFNLLSNAVKYTNPGGRVEYDSEITHEENGQDYLNFMVKDNGIGMSEEFQKHMYESFSQEQRKSEQKIPGTGLGLAIVKRLVDLMEGDIHVVSKQDVGTTFYVKVKTKQVYDCPQSIKQVQVEVDDKVLEGKRVLLFEDNDINTIIAEAMLEKKKLIVNIAKDGMIGYEMFRKSPKGYYDVILMDIMMPQMDGYDTTKAIRDCEHPDAKSIPIIAMTANAYASDIQKCIEIGMNMHVAKPINPEDLFSKLMECFINRMA